MGELIDNLSSFSLLAAGKLPLHKELWHLKDYTFLVNSLVSDFWERALYNRYWPARKHCVGNRRDLAEKNFDNIFQNVLRHANSGKYVSVQTKLIENKPVIIIEDMGPGMNYKLKEKALELDYLSLIWCSARWGLNIK